MVSYSTWRAFYRIPLIRENREAVRVLNDLYYVLITLHRANRINDFAKLRLVYFKMLHSFAQYGRRDAKDTVDQILQIPWFQEHQRDLYRLIGAYNHIMGMISDERLQPLSGREQKQLSEEMDTFFQTYKSLMRFDAKDDHRIDGLLRNKDDLDEIVANIHRVVGY